MTKLLSSGFSRLGKNKIFWLCTAAMLVLSLINVINGCCQAKMDEMSDFSYTLDKYFYNTVPYVGMFIAVCSSLFVGTEFSDGTIRNKLVVGHTRAAVYVSSLILNITSSLIMTLALFIGGCAGIPSLGALRIEAKWTIFFIAAVLLSTAAIASIMTLVEMLVTNKAFSAVAAIILSIILIITASLIYNALSVPEMSSGMIITKDGVEMSEPSPNPEYIGGDIREVYEFILQVLPTGQQILIANCELVQVVLPLVSSAVIILLFTLIGVAVFKRKDLK